MSKMRKFLVALGALAGVVSVSLGDGILSDTEIGNIVIAAVGAGLVWLIPNAEDAPVE